MGAREPAPNENQALIECHTDLAAFFHETLRSAFASRRIEAPVRTERYLVGLLAELGHDETMLNKSLVELELESHELDAEARLSHLRTLGDHALSISGLFEPHLERHGLTRRYVSEVGSRAYHSACQLATAGAQSAVAAVFYDLGERFRTYAEVLDDVREKTALGTPDDVLSLYERYEKTGSPALLNRLSARGVLLLASEQGALKA
jgi:hypothetical protein